MEAIKQQIAKLINKSNNILVVTPENIEGDALGSGLALVNALKKIGKNAQFVIPKDLPKKFEFLLIKNSFSYNPFQEKEFVLTIKNSENQINNLCYEEKDGLLYVYFKSKKKIGEKDFQLRASHFFDLIFTINSQDFENLGKIFETNSELFFETPVINVDNSAANESFGEINLIDITSSSVSEIIMELIDFLDGNLLDKNIATLILAGLIDSTNNFQSPKTTPKTFNNAALLINREGDQQKIINHFYKTKSINFLRLWGRILYQMSWDKEKKLVYGKIEEEDFKKTNTSPEYVSKILEEIKIAFPEMRIAFLVWSLNQKVEGIILSSNSEILRTLSSKVGNLLENGNLALSTRDIRQLPPSINKLTNESMGQETFRSEEIKSNDLSKIEKQVLDLINEDL